MSISDQTVTAESTKRGKQRQQLRRRQTQKPDGEGKGVKASKLKRTRRVGGRSSRTKTKKESGTKDVTLVEDLRSCLSAVATFALVMFVVTKTIMTGVVGSGANSFVPKMISYWKMFSSSKTKTNELIRSSFSVMAFQTPAVLKSSLLSRHVLLQGESSLQPLLFRRRQLRRRQRFQSPALLLHGEFQRYCLKPVSEGGVALSLSLQSAKHTLADVDGNDGRVASQAEAPATAMAIIPKKFVPFPFKYHEELTLNVSSLTNLGMGVCRINLPDSDSSNNTTIKSVRDEDYSNVNGVTKGGREGEMKKEKDGYGWVVMVPNVIPGETIRVRIFRNYKSHSEADLLDVLHASPERVKPLCALSTICGGCQYQHMSIKSQREWKQKQVQECLERIGGLNPQDFPKISETVGTDHFYYYRSKITPHYDAPLKKKKQKRKEGENGSSTTASKPVISAIGFKSKTSRQIIDVPQCHIATKAINSKLTELREDLHKQAHEGTLRRPHRGATLFLRQANIDDDCGQGQQGREESLVVTDPNRYVTTAVEGLNFRFQAGNFFQNNPFVLPLMVRNVVDASSAAEVSHDNTTQRAMTHLIDCYCGSGLFTLSTAFKFEHCVGIEVNERAVEEARANALRNGIHNCAFVSASAEAIFDVHVAVGTTAKTIYVRDFPRESTVVVLDPPRKGCSEEFLQQLYDYSPQRVVYMSCDPSTQSRDANSLLENGYEISMVVPFDLFPQTRHIESLMVFRRRL